MARRRSRRRSRRRRRPAPAVAHGSTVLATLTVGGLGLALGILHLIGPLPALAVPALWVRSHRVPVVLGLIALATALGASVLLATRPRLRWVAIVAWIAGIVAGGALYADRIGTIATTILRHGG